MGPGIRALPRRRIRPARALRLEGADPGQRVLHRARLPPGEPGYVTWTLDYTRESDLDVSVGYWAVLPDPERPGWSRLFYSIDMRVRGWMPGFLRNMIANEGLRDATSWVEREAEALQRERDAVALGGD